VREREIVLAGEGRMEPIIFDNKSKGTTTTTTSAANRQAHTQTFIDKLL